jgi:carbonic anhydrase
MIFRITVLLITLFAVACASKKKATDSADPNAAAAAAAPPPPTDPEQLLPQKAQADGDNKAQAQASEQALQTFSPSVMYGWGYEGEKGPENWGELKPEYLLCRSGKKQSPINLKWAKPKSGGEISFQYRPEPLKVTDNGYTFEVQSNGLSSAQFHGKSYALTHIQFRTSSEHALSGNLLPMEAQLFHKSLDGDLAVVSVILIQGKTNATIKDIFDSVAKQKGIVTEKPEILFDASRLLPDKLTHYNYSGSLTTPPCTEGVEWFVLNTPVELSKSQILQFRAVYSKNNRPLQPLNGRKVVNF